MSRRARGARAVPRLGKLPPRYRLFLNPYTDVRFTTCPQCRGKTRVRKLPLVIHVDPLWRFYDLGHGYCTYDFFDQCPHRIACAKCTFYWPKGSSQAQLLEAKANLLRLKQEIPLTEDEAAAVEDGLAALERLCAQLADVPTSAGPTPRELGITAAGSRLIATAGPCPVPTPLPVLPDCDAAEPRARAAGRRTSDG